MEKKVRSLNSIKVSHEKKTASCITEKMSVPETVCISMAQHIGAPCKPLVAKGDSVKVGQIIGDTDAFVLRYIPAYRVQSKKFHQSDLSQEERIRSSS